MNKWLLTGLSLFWVVWCVQAALSLLQVRKFWRRFDREPHSPRKRPPPPAVVIVPFKGIDADLETGVRMLASQAYPNYRMLLVVEATDDPAYPVLEKIVSALSEDKATILVAGVCGPDEGQKVRNQLCAIDHLLAMDAPKNEIWVFADSDVVPDDKWLMYMLRRLTKKNGLTTGYRWLTPMDADGDASAPGAGAFWSNLASVMNGSVASFLSKDAFAHAWGGAMAIRRKNAIKGDLRSYLVGALCDDYQFSRMVRDIGMEIYYEPMCLVDTPVRFSLGSLVNFAHRQYFLTRVYAPKVYAGAVMVTSLYVLGAASAWAALIYLLAVDATSYAMVLPALAMVFVLVCNHVRAYYRRLTIREAFGDAMLTKLRGACLLDQWATTFCMVAHWLLILRAGLGRTMVWRGVPYRLLGPQKVRRLDR